MEKKTANPAPLGLLGFGMTTILLNIHNLGFFPLCSAIIAMGIFYGGLAQIIAGILSYKNGNSFAGTAFTSYGFFWLTLVATWMLPSSGVEVAAKTPSAFFGIYLALWGIFTGFMWWGTWGGSKVQQFVFLSLTILFAVLAIEKITENEALAPIAGFVGVLCGSSAFYLAVAELLEEQKGDKVLPF